VKRIGLDLDGVLSSFADYVLPKVNARLGTSYTKDDWTAWEARTCLSKDAAEIIHNLAHDPMTYLLAEPIEGAVLSVRKLSYLAEIVIVTHRPENCRDATAAWLQAHQVPYNRLYIVKDKVETIKGLDLLAYVEDNGEWAEKIAESTASLLLAQPWNSPSPKVIRRESWNGLVKVLWGMLNEDCLYR
jgi:uncharacterized HAD superfamily protein